MTLWQEYRKPKSISEAIEDLLTSPLPAVPMAGGTDLLLDIEQGRHSCANTLVDLIEVAEMTVIELRMGKIFIGAAVSINYIIANPLLNQHAKALVEACNLIAGPQVRNIATLGGNVAHALPAADGTIALTALDAEAEIANQEGLHRLPLRDLFAGPGKTTFDRSSTIITGFFVNLCENNQNSCFNRIMRPQGIALPILNGSIWVSREEDFIKDIRIAVGPGGPVPFRALQVEEYLRNKPFNDKSIDDAITILLEEAKFRTSPMRATSAYRKHIAVSLFKDTLETAWQRARF
jgi:carbon-monoxide dehydrogenase medium subunit